MKHGNENIIQRTVIMCKNKVFIYAFAFIISFCCLPQAISADTPTPTPTPNCDANNDGVVDHIDLLLFMQQWHIGDKYTPTPTLTPTPTSTPTATSTPTPMTEITISLANLPVGAKPLVLVKVPAGQFTMGSDDPGWSQSWEKPPHQVNIGYEFYIGKYEITQAQWLAVMSSWPGATPNQYGSGNDYPAYEISWDDAQNFVTALNALGQGTFRLPSEAEWEYATRAGSTARWFFGDNSNLLTQYAWYTANSVPPYGTRPVGTKLPNAWGLHDTYGNVYECCEDDYHGSYSLAGRPDNGSAWIDNPRNPLRVLRGGIWSGPIETCRSSSRGSYTYNSRFYRIGLRVVRSSP
jgi:formylglycine-generating enzyme required for sulfatase activity